jgi:hypothetical protein
MHDTDMASLIPGQFLWMILMPGSSEIIHGVRVPLADVVCTTSGNYAWHWSQTRYPAGITVPVFIDTSSD